MGDTENKEVTNGDSPSFVKRVLNRLNATYIALLVIAGVIVAVFFVEDRYTSSSEAAELYDKACQQDRVIVAEMKNNMYKIENAVIEQLEQFSIKQDQRYLDELYRRKMLYERLLREDPDDQFLRDEYEAIQEDIKRIRRDIEEMRFRINSTSP